MSSKYDEQISRGMVLLDERVPGWEHRIDLERLRLSECKDCVVGQLFGGEPTLLGDTPILDDGYGIDFYTDGAYRLGVLEDDYLYGFTLLNEEQTFGGLTRAWKRAIR